MGYPSIMQMEDFFNAVVIRAAKDYVRAYKRCLKNPEDLDLREHLQKQDAFFHSEAYRSYTKVDGDYLLERLKEAVDNGDKLFPRRYLPPTIQSNT